MLWQTPILKFTFKLLLLFKTDYRSSVTNGKTGYTIYMTALLQNKGHKMLAIGGMPDHVHFFFGFRPDDSLSLLIQELKRCSTLWINDNHLVRGHFSWQKGYGAFSYSKSQIPIICNYIARQEEHHRKKSFVSEFIETLERFGVEYDKRYVFKDVMG